MSRRETARIFSGNGGGRLMGKICIVGDEQLSPTGGRELFLRIRPALRSAMCKLTIVSAYTLCQRANDTRAPMYNAIIADTSRRMA